MNRMFGILIWASLFTSAVCIQARVDTVYRDNGAYSGVNTLSSGWEESVILQPGAPCRIVGISVYYVGSGSDTIRITGDASEGTIPPTVWAYSYNTLFKRVVQVSQTGWTYIDLQQDSLMIGGFDRVVVQHLVRTGAPQFGQDAAQSQATSYYYDPISPNHDFYEIPGIYYLPRGDYMVRLHVEYTYPHPVKGSLPMPPPMLEDVTRSVGLLNTDNTPIRADMVSVVDINNDDFDDVVIGGQVFLNNRGVSFQRTPTAIAAGATAWADMDNDGDQDCFAMNGFGNDKIFKQNADGTFTDMGNMGVVNDAPAVAPLWLDYNGDGVVDLFIANGRTEQNGQEVYFQDRLFKNKGNGAFEDVTATSGIPAAEPAPFFDTWGASVCDYNNDGRPDIFVATYRLAPDRLYRNNGNGTFTDVSATTGVQGIPTSVPTYFGHGMGSDWGDMDNDGDVDLAVGNLGHPDSRAQYSNPSLLFRNNGSPTFAFSPITRNDGGVSFKEMNAGMCFMDLDHDGDLDLWHGQISYSAFGSDSTRYSHLYRNDGVMKDITWEMGMRIHGAWTGVRMDYDRDGDMDLLCASGTENVKLFRNDAARGNAVTVLLRHKNIPPSVSTPFGAHVVLTAQGKRYHRWLPGSVSGGRASQMSNDLHFGIGTAAQADSIVVYWGDGKITRSGVIARNSVVAADRDGFTNVMREQFPPRLLSPANHTSGFNATTTVYWHSVPLPGLTTEYSVQASYDSLFATGIPGTSATTPDTFYVFSGLETGRTVFWRVSTTSIVSVTSSVWSFTVGSPLPSTPTLVAPSDLSDDVRTKKAVFVWNRSEFTSYEKPLAVYDVQIASDTAFTAIAKEFSNVPDTSVTNVLLQPRTMYAWRVRARTASVTGSWSKANTFKTYGKAPEPVLVSPVDSAVGVAVRPALLWRHTKWEDQGFALQYDTLLNLDGSTTRSRIDTSSAIVASLKPGRRYYWRVAAKNDEGQGEWSQVWSFVVDNSSGVTSPADELAAGLATLAYIEVSDDCELNLTLQTATTVRVRVFDITSRCVAEPISSSYQPGNHLLSWKMLSLPSGPYFVTVDLNGTQRTFPVVVRH